MDEAVSKKSPIAHEIEELKQSVAAAQEKRARLPQPLFWSLFHHKIRSIQKKKELQALITELLDP